MKIHVSVNDQLGHPVAYFSDKGMKKGARKLLKDRKLIDLFPDANKKGGLFDVVGIDASEISVAVLKDKEFNERFIDDCDDQEDEF